MYCDVCIAALRDRADGFLELGTQIYIAHHKTFQSFKTSSAMGCVICHYYWRDLVSDISFRDWVETWIRSGADSPPVCGKVDPRDPGSAESDLRTFATNIILWKLDEDEGPSVEFVIVLNDRPEAADPSASSSSCNAFFLDPINDETKQYKVTGNSTSSDSGILKAKVWMEDCINNHKACVQSNTGNWAPTRILDLSSFSDGDGIVRLIVTGEDCDKPIGPYAAISYIWGGQNALRLGNDTITSFRQGIPRFLLPKTFREAIQTCQNFSIRYLWIDSLCILQDSHEDWLSESAAMEKVYAHSHLTIAAAASLNPSQGLFHSRDPTFVSPAENPIEVDISGIYELWSDDEETDDHDLSFGKQQLATYFTVPKDHGVLQSPLNSRGWCLQERILSPRVLGFCQDQIYWECVQVSAVENGCPIRTWPRPAASDLKVRFHNASDGALIEDKEERESHPYQLWGEIVEMYCKTRLTKESDRLIALSGLVKAYSAYMNDTYVGGMWKMSLGSELLWSRVNDFGDAGSSTDYAAPSFCWTSASLPCRLNIDPAVRPRYPIIFDVLQLQLAYAKDDKTGSLTGGHIDVSATVVEVRLTAGIYREWDSIKLLDCEGEPIRPSSDKPDSYSFAPDRILNIGIEEEKTRPFYLLLGQHFFSYYEADSDANGARRAVRNCSWILLEVVESSQGVYRRLGMVNAYQGFYEKDGEETGTSRHLTNLAITGEGVPNRGKDGSKYIVRIV